MVKSVFSPVHYNVSFTVNYYVNLVNVVNVQRSQQKYIWTPYSGYFGKIPAILSSRIIKICTKYNIKLSSLYRIAQINQSVI